jgi:hypothetical protein
MIDLITFAAFWVLVLTPCLIAYRTPLDETNVAA